MLNVREYFELIESIQLNKKDKDVKKKDRETWAILYDDKKYILKAREMGMNVYNVWWYLEGPKGEQYIELPKELENKKTVIPVFNKVLTALYQFLKFEKPDEFIFTAAPQLSRIYIAMLQRMKYEEPFKWYLDQRTKKTGDKIYHYFSRKSGLMPESRWKKVVKTLEN